MSCKNYQFILSEQHVDGFYVDVGCFHPKKHSNTYLLYKRGWSGINIDVEKTNLHHINSDAISICINPYTKTSPFGKLCGTSQNDQKRMLYNETFCHVSYEKAPDFTWKVQSLDSKELRLKLTFPTPSSISPG